MPGQPLELERAERIHRFTAPTTRWVLEVLILIAVLNLGFIPKCQARQALRGRQVCIFGHREDVDEGVPHKVRPFSNGTGWKASTNHDPPNVQQVSGRAALECGISPLHRGVGRFFFTYPERFLERTTPQLV